MRVSNDGRPRSAAPTVVPHSHLCDIGHKFTEFGARSIGIDDVLYGSAAIPCGIDAVLYRSAAIPCGIDAVPYGSAAIPCGIGGFPCELPPAKKRNLRSSDRTYRILHEVYDDPMVGAQILERI